MASILFAIIGPLVLKILEAIAMIIWVVPFHDQLTVYINLILLVSILVGMFAVLYGFHEWKLRLDIKRTKFVERDKIENQMKRGFKALTETVNDKAKETIMSTAVHITAITKPPEEREKMQEFINTIDFSPNGVDELDTDKMQEYLAKINKEVEKQIEKNAEQEGKVQADNKKLVTDIGTTADPIFQDSGTIDVIIPLSEKTEEPDPLLMTDEEIEGLTDDIPEESEENPEEPKILWDESDNPYTLNPDGKTRNYNVIVRSPKSP